MTYRAGIGGALAATLAFTGRTDPHLTCDECGAQQTVLDSHGFPGQFWIKKRTLRGWRTSRNDEDATKRRDICPPCAKAGKKP